MTTEDIIYQQKLGGYIYIYDKSGFITVYEQFVITEEKNNFIYSCKADCKSRKDFEMELIFISKKVSEL